MGLAAEDEWAAALSAWDSLEAECEGAEKVLSVNRVGETAAPGAKLVRRSKSAQTVAEEAAARRKSRAAGISRARGGKTFASESARLLATGPRAGCELRDKNGEPLRTIANCGIAKGARAELDDSRGVAACHGFAVRALESATPLLSHQTVARALAVLTSTGDMQRANKILHHDDVTTVRVVVARWFSEFSLPIPAAFTVDAGREGELSSHAKRRLKQRREDMLGFRFIVESCGCYTSTLAPLVPPQWIGREFKNGAELRSALVETADPGVELPVLATYAGLKLVDDAVWMEPATLQRCVAARQVSPLSAMRLSYSPSNGVVGVEFKKYETVALDVATDRTTDTVARVVTGCLLESTVTSAVVLEVPAELMLHLKQGESNLPQGTIEDEHTRHVAASQQTNFSAPSAAAQYLLQPAAQLQTSIRRGRGLCTDSIVRQAVHDLMQAGSFPVAELGYARTSGTRTLLWRLIGCIFQDVCPYAEAPDGVSYCSIQELVGLAALSHADHDFRLPPKTAERVLVTALRLHAYDGPGCVWPWRGWKDFAKSANAASFELTSSAGSNVRNAIRAALATMPMASGDKAVLLRHLGALSDGSQWLNKLRPLCDPRSLQVLHTTDEGTMLDMEARLAALDHMTRPNLLLFVQGCLPWIPREESQHSLSALAELIWRLSSSINVRTVRQRNAGKSVDEELLRITSFIDNQTETAQQQADKRMALDKYDPMRVDEEYGATKWTSAFSTMHLTQHESIMVKVITSVQRHVCRGTTASRKRPQQMYSRSLSAGNSHTSPSVLSDTSRGRGRAPTKFECRTSFLQLFGVRHDFSIPIPEEMTTATCKNQIVSVTVAGTLDAPVLVQTVGVDGRSYYVQQADAGGLYDKAINALVQHHEHGREIAPLPPCCPGFAWICANRAILKVRFSAARSRDLEFLVNDVVIPPFDASTLMVPANAPDEIPISSRPRIHRLLQQVMYDPEATMEFVDDPMGLLMAIEKEVSVLSSETSNDKIVAWAKLGTALPKAFWRDLYVKITCRENNTLAISPVGRDGRRVGNAVQPMTEGTMLRILIGLQLVYPFMLRRQGELRFKLVTQGKENAAAFIHLERTVSLLAFDAIETGEMNANAAIVHRDHTTIASRPVPRVITKLWQHQAEACSRTMQGILEGKRGFADASAVGAGKSLSSLAVMCAIADWAEKAQTSRHGFLVLVPTTALIREWELQAHLHTTGLKVLVQAANGALVSRGCSAAAKVNNSQSRAGQIDGCTLVITTLARARDKPFVGHEGWDFVVIDECLSVQNDTAVQTMEAWRQVAASRFGVLMLSATFFRSSFKRLFYMIRMLRSALPRTEPYLAALLREHVTVFVPENRRTWSLMFQAVPLGAELLAKYQQLVADGNAASREHRSLWSELRSFLRNHYDISIVTAAFASEAARLMRSGRKPALFANSDEEAARIMAAIPGSHGLSDAIPDGAKTTGPLVLTVHRHSHGLNLQGKCDALVCRPQPGDIIEQMKGRIDRPGQTKTNLCLVVLFASETIEEAEASNIKLCGAFFRQWLDPLSKKFQEISIEASIAAVRKKSVEGGSVPTTRKVKVTGRVAEAFHMQLRGSSGANAPVTAITQPERLADGDLCTTNATTATAIANCEGLHNDTWQHCAAKTPQGVAKRATVLPAIRDATPTGAERSGDVSAPAPTCRLFKRPRGPTSTEVDLRRPASPKSKKQKTPAAARRARECRPSVATVAAESPDGVVVVPSSVALLQRQPVPRMDASVISQAVVHLKKCDSRLAGVIAAIGQPTGLLDQIGGANDCFKSLAKSIVYQQLSVKVAAVIYQRLVELCGGEAALTPANALNLSHDDLRHKCGFSYRKAGYLTHLASSFVSGELSDFGLSRMSDEEAMAAVTKIKGLGEWSVHMFLMFSLGRKDVFPRGDLAIRKAMKRLYAMEDVEGHQTQVRELPPMSACSTLADSWRPFRTVGSWYMWHVVETKEAAYTFGA
eukprot:COSAG02_NODE_766_length_17389_cov_29.287045_1_plen_1976_part_00